MEKISKIQTTELQPANSTKIIEYPTKTESISGALATITGRYPQTGYAQNQISDEIAYILDGSGIITTPDKHESFSVGDVIFIPHGDNFAWEGNFTMFMATTPKYNPSQHIIK